VIFSLRVLPEEKDQASFLGPYVLFREVARGALASVYLGRPKGSSESTKAVAIKRLHPRFAEDPKFVAMYAEEARRVACIRHPNVVSVLEVVGGEGEVLLVMDYIVGEALSHLVRDAGKKKVPMPRRVFVAMMVGVLSGLEAAHETRDEKGAPLDVVHGDLSPHDVLVGLDGVPRVGNFGLGKGLLRELGAAESAQIRGKHAYMSPERLKGDVVDRRSDVYSAGVMLWEGLTGRRLFDPKSVVEASDIVGRMQTGRIDPPSRIIASTPKALDEIVMRALSGRPEDRFGTAKEMAEAVESAVPRVPSRLVGEWVAEVAGDQLRETAAEVREVVDAPEPVAPVSSPYEPFRSFIDLAAFAGTSGAPGGSGPPGDDVLKKVPPPPLLPRPQPSSSSTPPIPVMPADAAPAPAPAPAPAAAPKSASKSAPKAQAAELKFDDTTQPDAVRTKRLKATAPPRTLPRLFVVLGLALFVAAVWFIASLLKAD
jgi:eukaryotic-like serine/threonine-protein kinase